jgi:hypothetical protein
MRPTNKLIGALCGKMLSDPGVASCGLGYLAGRFVEDRPFDTLRANG